MQHNQIFSDDLNVKNMLTGETKEYTLDELTKSSPSF